MDQQLIELTTVDYHERIKRITLFEPLYELTRKSRTDRQGQAIDLAGLGLLTLLFFFEQKLLRQHKTGVLELASFLGLMTEEQYSLREEDLEELARLLIATFRPTTGRQRSYSFFNWQTKQVDEHTFYYLKAIEFDSKANRQYYMLDDDGLELVFATKEFYSEFQLSIHQLMLRKQLEKGEFSGALRQMNEMRMDVENIRERMLKLEQEIKRNIVSGETLQRYMKLLDDRNYRLHQENEEFVELYAFIQETKQRLYYQENQKKEVRAYELILQIAQELELVHAEHQLLLNQSLELKNQALQSAEESLYFVGVESFNFDQDITARLIGSPLPLEAMKGIIVPFLHVQQTPQWSLTTIFAAHSWSEEESETSRHEFMSVDETESKELYAKRVRHFYGELMAWLLATFQAEQTWSLLEVINRLKGENHPYLHQRLFYDFWLLCHQRSPLHADSQVEEEETLHLLDEAIEQLQGNSLTVTEGRSLIQATERYTIQDMQITIGGRINAL